ncbi:MAG: glycosyltransferase family 9 protein, partial [Candidatus Omnitrophica bacterium]|nr:glycosyltransferase family 9 protein [Candidatus Omnitrophota bacterium]
MMHTAAPRILIVRTDRIGDLVLSTPAIRAVRAAYPQGYLAALVQPATRALVDGHPALDEVLVLDKRGAHRGWRGFRRLVRELRARRFDQAFILHTTTRVVLATWWAGIPVRVGYARRLGWLLTHPAPYVKRFGAKHELDYTLDLVRAEKRAAYISGPFSALEIAWHAEGREPVDRWLAQAGIGPQDRMIVLHPGASCPSKRWPAARFAAVADRLAADPTLRFVAIAGPDDEALVRDVQRQARVPVLAPPRPFTLAELPWLLKRAQCLV